jgi:methylglutaconyl-CoA hydratase
VDELAKKLAGYDPEATRRLKEVLWEGTEGWPELLGARADISGTQVLSDYTRKAIAVEKSRTRCLGFAPP